MPRYHVFGCDSKGDTCLFETDYIWIADEFIEISGTAEDYIRGGGDVRVFDTLTNTYVREEKGCHST